jgi:hypothetical protein
MLLARNTGAMMPHLDQLLFLFICWSFSVHFGQEYWGDDAPSGSAQPDLIRALKRTRWKLYHYAGDI